MSMVNTKLYRNDAQQVVSSIAIILGFVLIGLSMFQIHLEVQDQKLAADTEKGEGDEAGGGDGAPAEQKAEEEKKKKEENEEDEDEENKSLSFGEWISLMGLLIRSAKGFQQVNFLMILLVWIGQFLKYGYDSYAINWMNNTFLNEEEYGNVRGIYLFNQSLMYIDGLIIMLGAISLLAYSTLLIPEIEVIVRTV